MHRLRQCKNALEICHLPLLPYLMNRRPGAKHPTTAEFRLRLCVGTSTQSPDRCGTLNPLAAAALSAKNHIWYFERRSDAAVDERAIQILSAPPLLHERDEKQRALPSAPHTLSFLSLFCTQYLASCLNWLLLTVMHWVTVEWCREGRSMAGPSAVFPSLSLDSS